MKRLVLALSLVFAFGAMCSGGGEKTEEPTTDAAPNGGDGDEGKDKGSGDDKQVVVVPVPDGGAGEHWCCEYEENGAKLYAIVAGPAECNAKFASKQGRWMEGTMCTPCCCKSPNDKADPTKGYTYELTTPGTCAGSGECLAGDAKECENLQPEPEPEPSTTPRPVHVGPSKAKRPR